MEFTLVQEGLTPLSADLMEDLVTTLDAFFAENVGEAAIRFDHLAESLRDPDLDWSDFPRMPTDLEVMAACCTLERRGVIQTEFVGGILHFVAVPCA